MTCPVKSIKPWRDLVAIQGENKSFFLWDKYDGEVPEKYYIKEDKSITEESIKEVEESTKNIESVKTISKEEGIRINIKPTKPSEKKVEDLKIKLLGILSSMGVTVEQFDDFIKEYGVDAIGVMEIMDGVAKIRFDENRADELTLPEETAHFFIELFNNTEIGKRLVESMKANEYYKTILGEEFDRYNELYKGDINKLTKEAAGKLLANAIVSKFNNQELQTPAVQFGLLTRFWNYIRGLFRNVNEVTTGQLVTDLYSEVAENILSSKYSHLRLENVKGTQRYFQISDLALNRLKKALDKTVIITSKRIEILKTRDKREEAHKDTEFLEELVEKLDNESYVRSAIHYADFAREKFKNVRDAIIAVRLKAANLDSIGVLEVATTMKSMQGFARTYSSTMKDLKIEIDRILLEEPENEDYKKVSQIFGELLASIEILQKEYIDLGKPIFLKYAEAFVGAGFAHIDLENELSFMNKDISWAQRMIDSMAEAHSPILRIIDVAVKESKRMAFESAYDDSKVLLQGLDDLHKSGVKNDSYVYERLDDDTLSGNFVTKYNVGQHEKNRSEFFQELLKDLNLPQDKISRDDILSKDLEKNTIYRKSWAKWMKENSQTVPNVSEIIAKNRKEMSSTEFAMWEKENTVQDDMGNYLYFRGELVIPSKKYLNTKYNEILSHKGKNDFYNLIVGMKEKLDKLLPEDRRSGMLAPQMRKDFVERIKDVSGGKAKIESLMKQAQETFIINEDDVRFGNKFKKTDELGHKINYVPVFFTSRLKEANEISTDATSVMSSYSLMANNYSQMNKIVDMLELGRDILDAREVLETDSSGNPIMESLDILGKKIVKKITKEPGSTNYIMGRLDDYYKMVVYGKMQAEESPIDMFGTKLNYRAMMDLLGQYTAVANLGLNIYAGIQNPIVGNTNIRLEGIAGQFVNNKHLFQGDKLYWKLMPDRIAQFGRHNVTNKMDLWYEYFDVMQEMGSHLRNMDTSRKNIFSRLFKTSSLFVFSSSGEHYMQLKMSFALAYNTQLKDKNGKDITLIDAYQVVGNKLQLMEGVTKPDGTPWTIEDTRKFIRRQNFINKRLHGIYNDIDKGALQQFAAFRLVLMFRKFMRPGFNRRYSKAYYSFEGQAETEGYYRTFGRFMGVLIKDIRRGEFLIKAHWSEMSTSDKANIMRTMGEIGFALVLMGSFMALNGLGAGDDKDDWAMNMFAYQVYRYQSELLFFIDPRQTFTLLKSPAAAVDQANRLLDLIFLVTKPGYAMEEISRGKWEGYTRLGKASVGTIPMFKTVHDWFSPEDKIIYFKLNQSR